MKPLHLLVLFTASCAAPDHAARPSHDNEAHSTTALSEHLKARAEIVHGEHTWLQSLVGTWAVTSKATLTPDAPPIVWTATETIRPMGPHWILAQTDIPGPTPFTSLFTLGYDAAASTMVATWVDTSQTHLWTYAGALAANTLTLHTEGPSLTDPNLTAQYRDTIHLQSPTQKTTTSHFLAPTGTWTPYMTATATRLP